MKFKLIEQQEDCHGEKTLYHIDYEWEDGDRDVIIENQMFLDTQYEECNYYYRDFLYDLYMKSNEEFFKEVEEYSHEQILEFFN